MRTRSAGAILSGCPGQVAPGVRPDPSGPRRCASMARATMAVAAIRYHRPDMNARIAPIAAAAIPGPAGAARLPRITVAAVVPDDGRFLFVEERVRGALVVNQPAGHLDPGESLVDAALRETLEETGWRIEVTGLIAIYHWPDPPDRKPVLRFTFAARPLAHDPALPLDAGIVRPLWLTPAELVDGRHRLRSPLVERSVRDFLAGARAPLALLASISA